MPGGVCKVQRAGSTSDERSGGGCIAGIWSRCWNVGATGVSEGNGAPHVPPSKDPVEPAATVDASALGTFASCPVPTPLPGPGLTVVAPVCADGDDVHLGLNAPAVTGSACRRASAAPPARAPSTGAFEARLPVNAIHREPANRTLHVPNARGGIADTHGARRLRYAMMAVLLPCSRCGCGVFECNDVNRDVHSMRPHVSNPTCTQTSMCSPTRMRIHPCVQLDTWLNQRHDQRATSTPKSTESLHVAGRPRE